MSNTAFPRFILKLAAAALLTSTVAGQVMAEPVWRFPYKGAPYAVPHEHNDRVSIASKKAKQASKRGHHDAQHSQVRGPAPSVPALEKQTSRASLKVSAATSPDRPEIVLAHHKPGYHVGLPRSGRDAASQPKSPSRT
jgi:hypothetical protein